MTLIAVRLVIRPTSHTTIDQPCSWRREHHAGVLLTDECTQRRVCRWWAGQSDRAPRLIAPSDGWPGELSQLLIYNSEQKPNTFSVGNKGKAKIHTLYGQKAQLECRSIKSHVSILISISKMWKMEEEQGQKYQLFTVRAQWAIIISMPTCISIHLHDLAESWMCL